MTTVIQTQTENVHSVLDSARTLLVEGATKTGDLIACYAKVLCDVFDVRAENGQLVTPWYSLVGKDKKGIAQERAQFVQAMIARGHTKGVDKDGAPKASATVDTYWQRVKEASGYVPKGRVSGGTDVDAKTLTELKTMINRILKSEEEGKECAASIFKGNLMEVFEGMGGDIGTLG